MAKVIFHIDLNAFFASAEIKRNSALEGKPVAVGGLSKRGVVSTANYEARSLGIHSAMPLSEALNLCPELVVLPPDFDYYEEISNAFFNFVRRFTKKIEPASIDECYADMSDVIKQYERPLDLAWSIQQGLLDELHLKCSIGIAPTRFLAKMASDMKKPLGIVVIRRSDIPQKLWPLPIESMFGIGKKTAPLLKKAHVDTIGDLVNPQYEGIVRNILGKQTINYINMAKGFSSDQLEYSHTMQSISQSTTMNNDVSDYNELITTLKQLSQRLSERCRESGISGKQLSVSIRYFDFHNRVCSATMNSYINETKDIYENALLLFDANHEDTPIRHLGISLGSLFSKNTKFEQLDFFNEMKINKPDLLKELNKQLSESGKLIYASALIGKEQ